ncbi:MAG: phosphotransferase [Verrucomicrobiales bacterium]|nr:phosphotransferase [Verrucomicrobiales bacterium]
MTPDLANIEALTREAFSLPTEQSLSTEEIIKGGSGRRFFRISKTDSQQPSWSVIAMHFTLERPENARFAKASVFLDNHSVHVPQILARNPKAHLLWLTDLGTQDLWETREQDWQNSQAAHYRSALQEVFKIHNIQVTPDSQAPALEPPFDAALYQWEQDYFFDEFASRFSDCSAEDIETIRKSPAAGALVDQLSRLPRQLIHRDFQSQNIMMRGQQAWLIDYQGMRLGLAEYDLASLLFDPYVTITATQRDELLEYYFSLKQQAGHSDTLADFTQRFYLCACQRLMQALGAYGFLGIAKQKTTFLQHIPPAVERLQEVAVKQQTFPALATLLKLKK